MNIPNLLLSTNTGSLKANPLINKLIVNPMPHKKDKPKMSFRVTSFGSLNSLVFIPMYVKKVIPMGFPNNRPRTIPRERGL